MVRTSSKAPNALGCGMVPVCRIRERAAISGSDRRAHPRHQAQTVSKTAVSRPTPTLKTEPELLIGATRKEPVRQSISGKRFGCDTVLIVEKDRTGT